jgi:hypothetical protein
MEATIIATIPTDFGFWILDFGLKEGYWWGLFWVEIGVAVFGADSFHGRDNHRNYFISV